MVDVRRHRVQPIGNTDPNQRRQPALTGACPCAGAAMLDDERQRLTTARGNHSFFFIPMQWWGVMAAVGGVANLLASAF